MSFVQFWLSSAKLTCSGVSRISSWSLGTDLASTLWAKTDTFLFLENLRHPSACEPNGYRRPKTHLKWRNVTLLKASSERLTYIQTDCGRSVTIWTRYMQLLSQMIGDSHHCRHCCLIIWTQHHNPKSTAQIDGNPTLPPFAPTVPPHNWQIAT